MFVPFESEFSQAFLDDLKALAPKNPVSHMEKFVFDIVLSLEEDDDVDDEVGCEVWTAACMLDEIVNGTDYEIHRYACEESYRTVLEMLRKDMYKTKLLSKKHIHNIPELLQNAIDALDFVLGINIASELAEQMRSAGTYVMWERDIIDLQNRLSEHVI